MELVERNDQAFILNFMENRKTVSRAELQEALNISQPTVCILIKKLLNQGVIFKIGNGRNVKYKLNNSDK